MAARTLRCARTATSATSSSLRAQPAAVLQTLKILLSELRVATWSIRLVQKG
jgi:hypothetical protein